jgi:hypothetical protein
LPLLLFLFDVLHCSLLCVVVVWCGALFHTLHYYCLLWCFTLALLCCYCLLWSIIFHFALLLLVVVHHPPFFVVVVCFGASPSPCNVHGCCYLLCFIIPRLVLLFVVVHCPSPYIVACVVRCL